MDLFHNCMFVDTNFFQPATSAHLDGHHIDAPGALWASVLIEITEGGLHKLALFASSYRFFGSAIGVAAPRFHFDEDQILEMFSDQVDFAVRATEVALQDMIAAALQSFGGQPLAGTTKALARRPFSPLSRRSILYLTPLSIL